MNGFSNNFCNVNTNGFPSPCGVWVVSPDRLLHAQAGGFRPLAGCGLFRPIAYYMLKQVVSVPLRGVGCFSWRYYYYDTVFCVSVPLRGVGCFGLDFTGVEIDPEVSVPLRGVGCFYLKRTV